MSQMVEVTGAQLGVNGDFFQWTPDPGGAPGGLMVRNGELLSRPVAGDGWRSWAFGWGPDTRSIAQGTWESSVELGGRPAGEIDGLNRRVEADELVLFTQSAGLAYGSEPPVYALIQPTDQNLSPQGHLVGRVIEVFEAEGRVRVPDGMALVAARGARAEQLEALSPGDPVRFHWEVGGFDWSRTFNVMGGGPYLVREGEIIQEPDEPRHPRTAVGWDAEGATWWVVIDGRQEVSEGTTLFETAEVMRELGCVEAINLDGGGSSTLHALGVTLNRPSAGAERTVANGILGFFDPPTDAADTVEVRWSHALAAGVPGSGPGWRVDLIRDGEVVLPSQIVWAAQGAAWIDGDGQLHPLAEGEAVITGLHRGRLVRIVIEVRP